jgi:aminoglycoside phosphotransferase (APT) family kinase protein
MMNDQEIMPGISRAGLSALLEHYQLGALESVQPVDASARSLLVNQRLLVRYEPAQPSSLGKEALIYRRLQRLADVPSPEVVAFDTQRTFVPFDVLVLRQVDGVLGSTIWAQLNPVEREQVSEELGRICGLVHTLPWAVYGEPGSADPRAQSARWIDIVMQKTIHAYQQAVQHRVLSRHLLDAFVTMISDGDAILNAADPPVLTHANLNLWNVLLHQVGTQWHVAALLGWESAIIAEPAWEFSSLWSTPLNSYPQPDAFMHGYKEARLPPHDLRVRQRLYRVLHHLELLSTVHAQSNIPPEQINMHRAAVEQLLTPH